MSCTANTTVLLAALFLTNYLQLVETNQIESECIGRIVEAYGDKFSLLAYEDHINLKTATAHLVVNLKQDLSYLRHLDRQDFYLIQSKGINGVRTFLDSIYRTRGFNGKAKTLIALTDSQNLNEVFALVLKHNLINVLLLLNNSIYTYYPVTEGKCSLAKPRLLFTCEAFSKTNSIYNESESLRFDGCPFRILAFPIPPYVYNSSIEENKGCQIIRLREMMKKMGLVARVVPHNITDDDIIQRPRQRMEKLKYMLRSKEVDLLLCFAILFEVMVEDFDHTDTVNFASFSFFVPKARPLDDWSPIFEYLDIRRFLVLLLLILIISTIYYFTPGTKSKYLDVFLLFYTIISNSPPRLPTDNKLRLILSSWMLFCLVGACMFQSQLFLYLTSPAYEHQITTVTELLNSKLEYGGSELLLEKLNRSDQKLYSAVNANYKATSLVDRKYIKRLISTRDFSFFADSKVMQVILGEDNKLVYQLPHTLVEYSVIYLDKGSVYKERLNSLLRALVESGLAQKWDEFCGKRMEEREVRELAALEIGKLWPIVVMYCVGIGLATLVFGGEILHNKICFKRNRQKSNADSVIFDN